MRHHATPEFWRAYSELPAELRGLTDKSFALLKIDPLHPSLHLKNVGRFWSARVGAHCRALAVGQGDELVWFWIGDHGAYDRLLKGR